MIEIRANSFAFVEQVNGHFSVYLECKYYDLFDDEVQHLDELLVKTDDKIYLLRDVLLFLKVDKYIEGYCEEFDSIVADNEADLSKELL